MQLSSLTGDGYCERSSQSSQHRNSYFKIKKKKILNSQYLGKVKVIFIKISKWNELKAQHKNRFAKFEKLNSNKVQQKTHWCHTALLNKCSEIHLYKI